MLSGIKIPGFSDYGNYNFNALILSLIIISVPILIALFMPLVKAKLGKKSSLFLYAFTTGFFLVLGLYGEANEGLEIVASGYEESDYRIWIQVGVVAGGATIGLFGALGFKYFLNKKMKLLNWNGPMDDHEHHDGFHNHIHAEDILLNTRHAPPIKNKMFAIYLLLSHRFGAGLFLGYTVYQIVNGNADGVSISFLIGFFLHIVPEEIIIFYRMRQMKIGKWRAMLYTVLMVFILVPFIFIGANIGPFISLYPWLEAIIHVWIGVFFAFVAIVEFLPEIIAEAKIQKYWYLSILFIIVGMVIAFLVMNLHVHDHHHHDEEHHHHALNLLSTHLNW